MLVFHHSRFRSALRAEQGTGVTKKTIWIIAFARKSVRFSVAGKIESLNLSNQFSSRDKRYDKVIMIFYYVIQQNKIT